MQSTIKKYVKIRKLILHQVFIEWSYQGHAHYQRRMKLLGTCSISKESHKKKKKMGLLFWGSGTPTFWLGLLLFTKRESRTPTFKILVRTLYMYTRGIFFLFLYENICCGYTLEAPQQGAFNEYHNICFCGEIRKNINIFGYVLYL